MKSRAAVAFAPGEPLKIVEIDVAPPQKGEVLVRITPQGCAIRMLSPSLAATRKGYSPVCWVTRGLALLWKLVKA